MSHDDELQQAVLAELRWEPSVVAAHIGVQANDGVVTLSGSVETFPQKHAAESAARRVKGVSAIAESMEVRLAPDTGRTDEAIAAAALERLAWDVSVPKDAVAILVENGWVTLSGQVDWRFQQEAAEREVSHLHGVRGLSNQTTIKQKTGDADVSAGILQALHRSWLFDNTDISVSAEQGVACLTGHVRSAQDREEAGDIAWAAPQVTFVENNIEVV
jgi:osmotically-inducible protein OsmY